LSQGLSVQQAAMLAPGMLQGSNPQQALGPTITSFVAVPGQNHVWTFAGTVVDTAPNHGQIVIALGGLPSLQGQTVTANSDGTFSITIQLQPGENGIATAQATDALGLTSEVAMAVVNGN
jgi:hypothetical protein